MVTQATNQELIEVAQGRCPADLFIADGTVVNVYSGELLRSNIAVYKGRIAYVGDRAHAIGAETRVISAEGKFVAPGFIEPHAHPWVLYNPVSYVGKVLSLGTTTIAHDNLFFYLHMGAETFQQMVEELRQLPGNHLWLVRLISQADYPGERELFNRRDLKRLLALPEVVGTAEVTRWPMLFNSDPLLLELLEETRERGKLNDGHTSGCSYEKLNSLVAAGLTACHEAITAEEALDRLRLGLWTTLRNSSLRPDFPEVLKLITEKQVPTNRVLMTTDGPHPSFIAEHGCVNGLVRTAVQHGVPPMQAIQMATINPATYLKMDHTIGGIAPGRRADLLIFPDLAEFRPEWVICGGELAAKHGELLLPLPKIDWTRYQTREAFRLDPAVLADPDTYRYRHNGDAPVPVIHFRSAVITQMREMDLDAAEGTVDLARHDGLLMSALIHRDGDWIARGLLEKFAVKLDGFASTYNTTTHLLVIGKDPQAMAKAALRVHEMGGGIVLVEQGEIVLEIPLPLAGMMTTDANFSTAVDAHDELLSALQKRGYPFHDILYSLLFLTCDNLPGLRLTPSGLYEVKSGRLIVPAARLSSQNI
ncbi:adenine deaminase C-terminal domain-containing protein [Brevibacillus fulvus]|uniref:adenine deaminase n=1 Tax=Brevibacillus fulvus TaxID=1125967 RepID=A0A938XWV5_9BACL|nr:adenine deaminase C-terminal domain-containing protein [Brevibacillus fulvus]MBM7589160.1 adenine deaminase [Brevibacillus fulvus]